MTKRFVMIMSLLLLMPSLAAADITVEESWVRLPPPVADTAAGYMTIRNSADKDVEIVAVESSAATKPEFHSMEMHDDMMHMMKMEQVIVPAHGELRFETGGNHLMLQGLTGELKTGDHVMMTLKTADGQSVMIHAEVRDMRAVTDHGGHGDMDHSGHGNMDHGSH